MINTRLKEGYTAKVIRKEDKIIGIYSRRREGDLEEIEMTQEELKGLKVVSNILKCIKKGQIFQISQIEEGYKSQLFSENTKNELILNAEEIHEDFFGSLINLDEKAIRVLEKIKDQQKMINLYGLTDCYTVPLYEDKSFPTVIDEIIISYWPRSYGAEIDDVAMGIPIDCVHKLNQKTEEKLQYKKYGHPIFVTKEDIIDKNRATSDEMKDYIIGFDGTKVKPVYDEIIYEAGKKYLKEKI